jgi:hypothetical protein
MVLVFPQVLLVLQLQLQLLVLVLRQHLGFLVAKAALGCGAL